MEKKIYAAIAGVMAEMSSIGISKDRKNTQQGYSFRGIDDVYNALAPALTKHRLIILPRVLSRTCMERESKNGGALFYVTVEAEFDLVSAEDGSSHTIRTVGEAMDSADKATNKAMSAAYKYAAFQAFCIPTEGDNDADSSHHEVKSRSVSAVGRASGSAISAPASTAPKEPKYPGSGEFLRTLELTTTEVSEFKSLCEKAGREWGAVALEAKAKGVEMYDGLKALVSEAVAA